VTLVHAEQAPRRYTEAFSLIAQGEFDALFVARNPSTYADRRAIVDFAVEHQLPGAYPNKEFAEIGGLISYGPSVSDVFRRAADLVDKILRGASPADLPIEQPTKFELAINLNAAKTLGLTVPPALLVFADELIE